MIREVEFIFNLASTPISVKAIVNAHLAIFPDGGCYRIIHVASGIGIAAFYSRDLAMNCFKALTRLDWAADIYCVPPKTVKAIRQTVEDFAEVEKW